MNIGNIIRDIETPVLTEGRSGDRADYGKRSTPTKAMKSKVKIYDTIKDALDKAGFGSIFSTKGSGRLYVVSKGSWGKKSGRGKIAKGFTKGSATPNASWGSIKAHSIRTGKKHGKSKEGRLERRSKVLAKKGK
jgi:hypothetical protein